LNPQLSARPVEVGKKKVKSEKPPLRFHSPCCALFTPPFERVLEDEATGTDFKTDPSGRAGKGSHFRVSQVDPDAWKYGKSILSQSQST
jgi:hypothetical protein